MAGKIVKRKLKLADQTIAQLDKNIRLDGRSLLVKKGRIAGIIEGKA